MQTDPEIGSIQRARRRGGEYSSEYQFVKHCFSKRIVHLLIPSFISFKPQDIVLPKKRDAFPESINPNN